MFANFDGVVEGLVVRVGEKLGRPRKIPSTFDSPNDGGSPEVEGGPVKSLGWRGGRGLQRRENRTLVFVRRWRQSRRGWR